MDSDTDTTGQRRPRRIWTTTEKLRLVAETYEPGASVGRVARRNEIEDHLLRRWRRLVKRGAFGQTEARDRCVACGEPFEAARLDAKFCSSKCRQKAFRQSRTRT